MSKFGQEYHAPKKPAFCVDESSDLKPEFQRRRTPFCPCFTPGTMIKTNRGEVAVQDLEVGLQVLTRDNGFQPIVWVGHKHLTHAQMQDAPELSPVVIGKNALGAGIPERQMRVSPQHRMLLSNAQIRDWFASDEVLIAAHLLTCFEGIERAPVDAITYVHFMFAQHEIVLADGAWSESYQPQDMSAGAMDEAHRRELLAIFPELEHRTAAKFPAARPEYHSNSDAKTTLNAQ